MNEGATLVDHSKASRAAGAEEVAMFSLSGVTRILRRNALLIVALVVLALLISLFATLLATPRYRASATLQIDQQVAEIIENSDTQAPQTGDVERYLQTQLDILRSRSLALKVAQRLNLLRSTSFASRMAGETPEAGGARPRPEQVIAMLRGNLETALPRNSQIVEVSFVSPDPGLARDVVNAYVTEFVSANLQRKYDSSAYAREFLRDQLADTKRQVERAEQALNNYSRQNAIIRTESRLGGDKADTASNSLVGSSLNQVNSALDEARSARITAEGRWQIAQASPALTLPAVLENGTVQSLLQQRAAATVALRQEEARRLPGHPSVIQLRAQVAALNTQLNGIASDMKSAMKKDFDAAARREEDLRAELDTFRKASLSEQDRSVQYNFLAREASTARSLYASLLDRYNQLRATAGISLNNLSVVDMAEVPRAPYSPNLTLNLALGLVVGSVLAGIAVLLREQIDEVVRSPSDVRQLSIPLLGAVPLVEHRGDALALLSDPKSSLSEAFASIRTSLMHATPNGAPPVLFLTSTLPGEGKTLSSYALALAFAHLGKRTLLVAADLRRPSLHKLVSLDNSRGLSDILSGNATADEVTFRRQAPNLDLILSGSPPPNPTDLLAGPVLKRFLAEQVTRYDVVVVDGPPVLGLADAPIISGLADGTIFLIGAGLTKRGASKIALRRLLESDAQVVGGVLNRFVPRSASESDYYYARDYYSYS